MNRQRWELLLLAALAIALAAPGSGQSAAPAAPVPDFSGIWDHPALPGFEPLATGPTSLRNRSRRNGVSNPLQLVGDYTNPILKPHAAEVVRKHGEISLAGASYPTPSNQCWPSGLPYIFFQHGMQMLQLPQKIVFLYLRNHEYRQVRLNQPHPAHVTPSWNGDSVGHYEGATLVIDTVGVKPIGRLPWSICMARPSVQPCMSWNAIA